MDEHTDYMVEIRQPVVQSTILMQPGLLAATSCPFSVRRWRQREGEGERETGYRHRGGDREGICGPKRIGRGIEGKDERGEDRRKAWCASCLETAPTHVTHQQGRKGGFSFWGEHRRRERETGVVKLLSSLSASVPGYCLFTAMADRHMNVWQGRQKEC